MAFSIFTAMLSDFMTVVNNVKASLLVFSGVLIALFILPAASLGAVASNLPLDDNWKFFFAGKDSSVLDYSVRYEEVHLPHIFSDGSRNNSLATGIGWYFKDVEIPPSFSNKDVFLNFEGVCLRAKVFVDGVDAGVNSFAYLPFRINLTPFLKEKNRLRLAVMVDNRLLERSIPDVNAKGWKRYGGIEREVGLCACPQRRIDNARIFTTHIAGDTFELRITLKQALSRWDSVVMAIAGPGQKTPHCKAIIRGTDTVLRLGGIHGWTPESPFRYTFSLTPYFNGSTGDTMKLMRGFCQLTARKTKLYLNGKPYYLRGIGRHDVLDNKGPMLTREERRRDLEELKSLGVNFLRIAHFPQHRDIYELCDSLGILVMDEIPVWKTESRFLGSKEGIDCGTRYMKNMVEAHGNFTCVCMWSLGNQFGSYKTSVAGYVEKVSAEVKKSDPSRLVTFCSFYYIWDKAFSYVDVISVNEYFGWELASLGMLGPMLDRINKDWPGKPVLVSELGAQSETGLRNPRARLAGAIKSIYSKDLSEDHQALFIRSHMDTIWSKRSFVGGLVVWAYADYMTSQNKARTADMPAGLNACGIVTQDRKRKLSYEVVKERYGSFGRKFSKGDAFSPGPL
jgi:beta-glucuronidase